MDQINEVALSSTSDWKGAFKMAINSFFIMSKIHGQGYNIDTVYVQQFLQKKCKYNYNKILVMDMHFVELYIE